MQPSQFRSSYSSSSLWFTLKYFLNYPSMIHSYYISYQFQSSLLMSASMSKSLYSSHYSRLVLMLHIPCSTTGSYILLNIFLSHVFSLFISTSVIGHFSLPYTTTGYIIVLCIFDFNFLLVALDLNIFPRLQKRLSRAAILDFISAFITFFKFIKVIKCLKS
jgi:hypothetical protein